ncbi:MAG: hypothetical protein J6B23_06440, partial [Clostridia bacterium]|nr:hypothetical protein [Clostridia bacterium]
RANSDGEISGVIEEISDDAFVINGEKYEINSYFKALGIKLSPGMSYSFLTAPNGSITAISGSGEDGILYGYLLGFNPDKTFDKSPMVRILSSSNQKQVYELADKIRLNGTVVKNTHSDIELKLKNGEYPAYQLIRYKLSDDKISMIDTSEYASDDWESAEKKYMGDNTLTKFVDRVSVNYRSNIGFGVPNVSFKGSVIFSVPEALQTNANAHYDDELFSVISTSSLANNGKYVADAYDFDENYIPGATVVYKATGGKTTESPTDSSAAYMIYEVTDSLNPDGDNAKLVKCYSAGVYSEFYIEPQVYDTLSDSNKIPSVGDVARFTFNAKGYINGIGLDIDYNPESDSVTIAYGEDNLGTGATAYLCYFGGRALSQTAGYLTIKADNPPKNSAANSSNIINLAVNPSSRYVLFNKKTNKVETGSSADVVTAIEGGAENASLVVCKATYYYVNTVFVYTD